MQDFSNLMTKTVSVTDKVIACFCELVFAMDTRTWACCFGAPCINDVLRTPSDHNYPCRVTIGTHTYAHTCTNACMRTQIAPIKVFSLSLSLSLSYKFYLILYCKSTTYNIMYHCSLAPEAISVGNNENITVMLKDTHTCTPPTPHSISYMHQSIATITSPLVWSPAEKFSKATKRDRIHVLYALLHASTCHPLPRTW